MDRHSVRASDWVRVDNRLLWPFTFVVFNETMEAYQESSWCCCACCVWCSTSITPVTTWHMFRRSCTARSVQFSHNWVPRLLPQRRKLSSRQLLRTEERYAKEAASAQLWRCGSRCSGGRCHVNMENSLLLAILRVVLVASLHVFQLVKLFLGALAGWYRAAKLDAGAG